MTIAGRADRIVAELVAALNKRGMRVTEADPCMGALEAVIIREMQAVSNEGVALARGKQLAWIVDEIIALSKRGWPEDVPGDRASQRNISNQITEEHGELLGKLRSFHGRKMSPEKTASREEVVEECGDLLVACLKMAWLCNVNAAEALQVALAKIRKRVDVMEARLDG